MARTFVGSGTVGALLLACVFGPAQAQVPDWADLIKAAQQEGGVEVLLIGQVPGKLRPILPEFEKKYGVKVNFQTGSGRASAQRLLAERQLGRYTLDVIIGGAGTANLQLVPNGVLADLRPILKDPNVTDQSLWFQGKHHYSDPDAKYVFAWGASPDQVVVYNTTMVDPNEIKSWADLLNPKWKGKVVSFHPAFQGNQASSVPLLINKKVGADWFKRWATEIQPTIVTDARQGAEWVALGRFAIGLFGVRTSAIALHEQGFPIQSYLPHQMAEGTVLSAGAANIMVIDQPPHPNATALFVNWALSTEGQTLIVKAGEKKVSLRIDVPGDLIEPQYRIPQGGEYYIPFEDQDYMSNFDTYVEAMKKIMAEAGYNQ